MYIATISAAPYSFNYLEVFYTEDPSLMCGDCGCQFLSSEINSSFVHSTKLKRKPFEYGGKGVKVFHQERCPICTSPRLNNLKSILQ